MSLFLKALVHNLLRKEMKLKLTCEYSLLSLDEALLVVELHAEVDEGEHGQVHQHALDQEGVLVALAVPGKVIDINFSC